MNAKDPSFIRSGGDHSSVLRVAANQHRLAHQVWVIQLLNSCVEGVKVGVDDVAQGP
jgi:hypothetical protein